MLCALCHARRTLPPSAPTHPLPLPPSAIHSLTHYQLLQVRQGAGGPVCSQRAQQARAGAVQGQGCAVSGRSPLPGWLDGVCGCWNILLPCRWLVLQHCHALGLWEGCCSQQLPGGTAGARRRRSDPPPTHPPPPPTPPGTLSFAFPLPRYSDEVVIRKEGKRGK